jgi:hypothetical protein
MSAINTQQRVPNRFRCPDPLRSWVAGNATEPNNDKRMGTNEWGKSPSFACPHSLVVFRRKSEQRLSRVLALVLASVLLFASDSHARITKSRSSVSSANPSLLANDALWSPLYSTVFGGGIEFSSGTVQDEYTSTFLIEYMPTEQLKLIVEPQFVSLVSRVDGRPSLQGWGDLETTLDYEFLRERRYRPALSFEAGVQWPTAVKAALGEPGREYAVGLLASKDLVFLDVDFNALYLAPSNTRQPASAECSLGIAYHMTPSLDLIAEAVVNRRLGGQGMAGSSARRFDTEATLGLSWQVNDHLTLQQGVIFKHRRDWTAIIAFEWSLGDGATGHRE